MFQSADSLFKLTVGGRDVWREGDRALINGRHCKLMWAAHSSMYLDGLDGLACPCRFNAITVAAAGFHVICCKIKGAQYKVCFRN